MKQYIHCWVSMVVPDGLAPIHHQNISNYVDDAARCYKLGVPEHNESD